MRLIQTSSASDTGATVRIPDAYRYTYRPVQVTLTGSATVSIQGRVSGSHDFVELYSATANAIEMIAVMREMQVVVTGNDGDVLVDFDVRERV